LSPSGLASCMAAVQAKSPCAATLGFSNAARTPAPGDSCSSSPARAASNCCLTESMDADSTGRPVIAKRCAGVMLPGPRGKSPAAGLSLLFLQEHYMKKLLSLLAAASLAFSFAAQAADASAPAKKELTPQQQKMKTCN